MCLLALNLVSCGKEVAPEKEKKDNPQEQTDPDPDPEPEPDPEPDPDPDPEPDGGYTIDSLGTYAPIRILFIGNSHTLDSTDLLPLILNEAGVKNIELTRAYHGGYYLVGYNANYDSPTICSWTRWQPGQNMWRGSYALNHSLREVVEDSPYDIVVLQEYTGASHCWTWDDAERSAIRGLCDKILAANPKAELIYFISHCHAANSRICTTYFEGSHVKQFNTVISENAEHAMDPAEGFPFKKIISNAALIENLRTTALDPGDGLDLMRGDGVHLDYGLSRMAASLLFWKTIFTPITGIQAEDITFRIHDYFPSFVRRRTPVTDENWPTIIAAVQNAYDHPFEITDMSSYSSRPNYTCAPGTLRFDGPAVEISPVSFPVQFPVSYGYNNTEHQGFWSGYALWRCHSQPQAYARWIHVSFPVAPSEKMEYTRTFASSASDKFSSPSLVAVWTGDYFEFTIPVKNFKAGTKVRFSAPFYTRLGPCFWYLDYYDGDEWKCDHSTVATLDGTFERDASFAIGYGTTVIEKDVTFSHGIPSGYLRFRVRCADGSIQAASTGAVERETPSVNNDGNFNAVFYFRGNPGVVSFSIVNE